MTNFIKQKVLTPMEGVNFVIMKICHGQKKEVVNFCGEIVMLKQNLNLVREIFFKNIACFLFMYSCFSQNSADLCGRNDCLT